MLTELQKRKLTVLFHHHDTDNDGFMGKADYERFAERLCEVQGYAPDSPQCQTAHTQNMAVWEQVRQVADKDGDGRVSLEEYLESWDITLSDKRLYDQLVAEYSQSLMALWDRDGDGRLSGVEYTAFLGCYGVGEKSAREAFQHLDQDGLGYLTTETVTKRYEEFFLSDDPATPGSFLFGSY
jgi:juvenile hormone diol kinase